MLVKYKYRKILQHITPCIHICKQHFSIYFFIPEYSSMINREMENCSSCYMGPLCGLMVDSMNAATVNVRPHLSHRY